MSDETIPDDVMKAARECCHKEQFRLMAIYGKAILDDGTIEAVARVIMAERERHKLNGLSAIGFETGGGYVLKLAFDTLDNMEAARNAILKGADNG